MLTSWLIFTALWSCSVSLNGASVTVAPLSLVEAPCTAELSLRCGDGHTAGLVQYWHTPFGDVQPGFQSDLDPVYVQHEGSLVLSHISSAHSGLYYCLLQHQGGATLWPHQLHVGQGSSRCEEPSSHGGPRSRREAGSGAGRQGDVSDGQLTGAVIGAVLLTFVVGFSSGALCRNLVLRCLGVLLARLRSPRKQPNDVPDQGSDVSMATLSPTFNIHVVGIEEAAASTDVVPPAKPQRSFRERREDELKGKEGQRGGEEEGEEGREERNPEKREEQEEEKRGRCSENRMTQKWNGEIKKEKGEEEDEDGGRCLADGNPACKGETEGDEGLDKRKRWSDEEREEEEQDGGCDGKTESSPVDGREEIEGGKEKEKEETSEQENRGEEGEDGDCVEARRKDGIREEEERDGETDSEGEESPVPAGPPHPPTPRPARPGRVIRLYQYDEEGRRYSHVPQPLPHEPGPAPRLQQRSISLTRLGAIMAAASAGPLDLKDPERGDSSDLQGWTESAIFPANSSLLPKD